MKTLRLLKATSMNRWVLLTLAVGITVSGLAAWQLEQHNRARLDEAVANAAGQAVHAVQARMELYEYGIHGARGAIITSGEYAISRERFHQYSLSRNIDDEFPGARGFGFIRRVPQSREDSFVSMARYDDWPDFEITALTPHDRDRFVIQYIEPVERNIQAVGLDIGSERNRREAAEAAIRTGEVRLTAPLTLVQATGNPLQSFLILMPIYRGAETPDTQAERLALAYGWSYAPLLMKEVLADLRLNADAVDLELYDVTEPGGSEMFYRQGGDGDEGPKLETRVTRFDIYGRTWESRFSVHPLFVERLGLVPPLPLFLLGGLISALAASLIGALGLSRRSRRQAHAEQARLAAIVECSADGIIGKTLEGVVTSWNQGAESIFGHTAEAAIGRSLADLIVPPELHAEDVDILARIGRGETISHFETIRRHADGRRIDVAVTVSPIRDDQDRVIGASKMVRDISRQKTAEEWILELNSNLEANVALRTSQLTQARDQLLVAAEVAKLGIWSWCLADDSLEWNDKMFELYGQPLSLRDTGLDYEHWRSRLHPDDAEDAAARPKAAVQGSTTYESTFRLKLPNGRVRYIQAGARVMR